jgi:hypothetical protein
MLRRAFVAALLGLLAAPAKAQTGDPSFRIVNNAPRTVLEVYASPSNDRSWGHDRLGSEVIPPGGRHIIRLPADGNCIYDVRIVYQGGAAEERRNVNLCAVVDYVLGGGAPPAQAANPSFNLVNQGRRTIREFYASPSSQQSWGPDRLGTEVVGPGQRFPVRLPVGECTYDIRIVFQDGEAREQRRINACGIVDYVVR